MKSLCVKTIKLNTLTDVPYQMTWVGHLFTYVKTCERGHVNDFEQRSRVYNAVRYNAFFLLDPDDRDLMESQCILKLMNEMKHNYSNYYYYS